MSFRVKVISTALNIVCLLHTLFFPGTYVMWAMLPVLITAASWIFSTEQSKNTKKGFLELFLFIVSILGGIVFVFLGLSGSVSYWPDNDLYSVYLFCFHKGMMIWGGESILFWKIAAFVLVLLLILFFGELFAASRNDKYEAEQPLDIKIRNKCRV